MHNKEVVECLVTWCYIRVLDAYQDLKHYVLETGISANWLWQMLGKTLETSWIALNIFGILRGLTGTMNTMFTLTVLTVVLHKINNKSTV